MTTLDVFRAMSQVDSRKNLAKLLSEGKNADFASIKASLVAGKKLEVEALHNCRKFDKGTSEAKEASNKHWALSKLYYFPEGVMVYAYDFENALPNIEGAIPIWEIPTTERMDALIDLATTRFSRESKTRPTIVELGCGAALWTAMLRRRAELLKLEIDVIATNQECKTYLHPDFVQVSDIESLDWKDAVTKYKSVPGVVFFFSWCQRDMDPTDFMASQGVDLFVLIGKQSCCAHKKKSYEHKDYFAEEFDVPGMCAYEESTQFYVMTRQVDEIS